MARDRIHPVSQSNLQIEAAQQWNGHNDWYFAAEGTGKKHELGTERLINLGGDKKLSAAVSEEKQKAGVSSSTK